ncbi:MAG: hypothetical protein FWE47_01195 [Oscillospiraceae bacterium]|nr:hypothetical protein [Oscillospiraceae bacterium]
MKKSIFLAILISLLISNFSLLIASAAVGNVTCIVTKPDDFNEPFVVKIYSVDIPGYDEQIVKEADITPGLFYLNGFFPGIPAGRYNVETYLYQAGDPDKKPYVSPNWRLESASSFQLLAEQNYEYKINVTKLYPPTPIGNIPGENEEEPGEEEPTIEPEPTIVPKAPNAIVSLFTDIFKNSAITIILLAIAGAVYLFIRVRKTIYKE